MNSDDVIRDFLNTRLTDPQSSRTVGTTFSVSNWPYFSDFTVNDYPKIAVVKQRKRDVPFSLGTSNSYVTERLSITIFAKPDQVLTIDGNPYEGFNMVRKIEEEIETVFKTYMISDLLQGNFLLWKSIESDSPLRNYDYNLIQQNLIITMEKLNI